MDADEVANALYEMCQRHFGSTKKPSFDLYRIFYYDCLPYNKRHHHPITNRVLDFERTNKFTFQTNFLEALKRKRKVALRLGVLESGNQWTIRPKMVKALLQREIEISELSDQDVQFELRQKGVDMKIGLDIATLTLKKQVGRIILVSGDSDFVPAAKLARREGVDFILDPMWNPIKPNLFEHIDGLRSMIKRPS